MFKVWNYYSQEWEIMTEEELDKIKHQVSTYIKFDTEEKE